MRRLMAAEVAAAAARGETLDEEDSETSEDLANPSDHGGTGVVGEDGRARLSAAAAALAASAAEKPKPKALKPGPSNHEQNRPLRDPELDRLSDWGDEQYMSDKGHEADADDTSLSSRASSRVMGESVDSMSALYDSEYDNYYRGAGGNAGLGSDYDSDFFPEDKVMPNLLTNGAVVAAAEPSSHSQPMEAEKGKTAASSDAVRELKC
jgi:hypothetical protein